MFKRTKDPNTVVNQSPAAPRPNAAPGAVPAQPGRLAAMIESMKSGLAQMFAAIGPNATSATLEDEVGAVSLTGATVYAKTKISVSGDPAKVGQLQVAIDQARQHTQAAIAAAKEETERARIAHDAGHNAQHR